MVNEELSEAIKFYCSALPYPNRGASPNDDRRLYNISRLAVLNDISIKPDMLLPYLEKNTMLELTPDDLEDFAINRVDEINHGAYIIRKSLE